MQPTPEQLTEALGRVIDPELRKPVTELGMVRGVDVRGGVSPRTKGISLDRSTRVIAIASGKGGVGKSTLTANLAAAFARLGHRTGVLDADVYGHSIPHMLGVHQRPISVEGMI